MQGFREDGIHGKDEKKEKVQRVRKSEELGDNKGRTAGLRKEGGVMGNDKWG